MSQGYRKTKPFPMKVVARGVVNSKYVENRFNWDFIGFIEKLHF
jgi:hypothetical protein